MATISDGNKTAGEARELEKHCRDAMIQAGLATRLRNAINGFLGKGTVRDPDKINVKVNRFMPDLQMVAARDAKILLSSRPYMPLAARNEEFQWEAQKREEVLDDFAEQADYFGNVSETLYLTRGLGWSFLECGWKVEERTFTDRRSKIDPILGIALGREEFEVTETHDGLDLHPRGPWSVILHPHGKTMDETPVAFVKDIMSVDELLALHESGALEIPDDADREKLKAGPDGGWGDEWGAQWRRDRATFQGPLGDDIGVLMRGFFNPSEEHPRGRWVYLWNYTIVCYDGDPRWDISNPKWKPLVMFKDMEELGPNSKYGLGLYEQTRRVAELGDDMLSAWVDAQVKAAGPGILYDSQMVDGEKITGVAYERVPLKVGQHGDLDNVMRPIPRTAASDKLFDGYKEMESIGDRRVQAHYPQTGEPAPRKETFGTTGILQRAGDMILELRTRLTEGGPFKRVGLMSAKLIDANATPQQIVAVIGEENAARLLSVDPETIPGGFKWMYEGSASIMQKAEETETLLQWWNMFANDPEMQQKWVAKRRITRKADIGFSDEEVDGMFPNPMEGQAMPPPMPGQQTESLGETGAIVPPNQIATPATNAVRGVT